MDLMSVWKEQKKLCPVPCVRYFLSECEKKELKKMESLSILEGNEMSLASNSMQAGEGRTKNLIIVARVGIGSRLGSINTALSFLLL